MQAKLRIAYIVHSLRSDWNNGNAHFLRGLIRSLGTLGHDVVVLEPEASWSLSNLQEEPRGAASLEAFRTTYPDLAVQTYSPTDGRETWRNYLKDRDVVVLHEWNPPALAQLLLDLRNDLQYKLLFHDTHHRASSSPEALSLLGIAHFDGVLAFGEVLRSIYRERFGITAVWTLHEAADTSVFRPIPSQARQQDIVWIGNWGDEERSAEINNFLLQPAAMIPDKRVKIFGVRFPEEGRAALNHAGVHFGGYLPNLSAPQVYAESRLTLHIPRREYSSTMPGIPTIRVFEALACGIPLLSAPWHDTEHLFNPGDLRFVSSTEEMAEAMQQLLDHPEVAQQQAARGLSTVLSRHTCDHRAQELTAIVEEILA